MYYSIHNLLCLLVDSSTTDNTVQHNKTKHNKTKHTNTFTNTSGPFLNSRLPLPSANSIAHLGNLINIYRKKMTRKDQGDNVREKKRCLVLLRNYFTTSV